MSRPCAYQSTSASRACWHADALHMSQALPRRRQRSQRCSRWAPGEIVNGQHTAFPDYRAAVEVLKMLLAQLVFCLRPMSQPPPPFVYRTYRYGYY